MLLGIVFGIVAISFGFFCGYCLGAVQAHRSHEDRCDWRDQ